MLTGLPDCVMIRERSALVPTTVVTEAELLVRTGSAIAEVTIALLVNAPVFGIVTVIVTVAMPLLAMVPKVATTTPLDCVKLPWEGWAETKVTPAGRKLVSTTPVAAEGPKLLTVFV